MSLQSRDYLDSPSFVERLYLPRRGVAGRERDVQRGPVKAEQRRPGGSGRTAQPSPTQPNPARPLARPRSPRPVPHLLLKRTGVAAAVAAASVSAMATAHVLPVPLPGSEGSLPVPSRDVTRGATSATRGAGSGARDKIPRSSVKAAKPRPEQLLRCIFSAIPSVLQQNRPSPPQGSDLPGPTTAQSRTFGN